MEAKDGHTNLKVDKGQARNNDSMVATEGLRPHTIGDGVGGGPRRRNKSMVEVGGENECEHSGRPQTSDHAQDGRRGRNNESLVAAHGGNGSWTQRPHTLGGGQVRGHERETAQIARRGWERMLDTAGFYFGTKRGFWTGKCVGRVLSVVGADVHDTAAAGNPWKPCKTGESSKEQFQLPNARKTSTSSFSTRWPFRGQHVHLHCARRAFTIPMRAVSGEVAMAVGKPLRALGHSRRRGGITGGIN